MDDESGWSQLLVELWNPRVRDAVVADVERVTTARHGWLVRVFSDPEGVRSELTETIHTVVLASIQRETGADLDGLGSQAAWDCYEQVWWALSARWADGGDLAVVALEAEMRVVTALTQLPSDAALAAGAEPGAHGSQPLWLGGRLRVDVHGLRAHLEVGDTPSAKVAAVVEVILRALR